MAVASFHLAYEVAYCAPLVIGFFLGVLQLARAESVRGTLYFGWAVGLCVYGPQLCFFWSIFHAAAIVLWLILSAWLVLYLLLQRFAWQRMGRIRGTLAAPLLWLGLEYFRSELYYLRFSWVNAGYLLPNLTHWLGMYGAGFLLMLVSACLLLAWPNRSWRPLVAVAALLVMAGLFVGSFTRPRSPDAKLAVAGVQLEGESNESILRALDQLDARYPDVPLFVLSEYSFATPIPPEIKAWCARRRHWLVAGGKAFLDRTQAQFYDTVFVIGPDGKEVFRQGKSRPIQLFDDGLPAPGQAVWDSPWGKVGLCICYDLSYTRVTDALIRQGARVLIVPTMDVQEWGEHEHDLHARVAPARAAEYGVPIFRLASSGISQAVASDGRVLARASFPGQGQMLAATLDLPADASRVPLDRLLVWPCLVFAACLFGWQSYTWVEIKLPRPGA